MFKINGQNVPAPSRVTVNLQDLSSGDSGRNADGTAMIDFIATKRKIEVEWPAMYAQPMAELMTAMKPITFTVTYIDPETGTAKTITCYKGDRTAPVYNIVNGVILWESMKCNFIEV